LYDIFLLIADPSHRLVVKHKAQLPAGFHRKDCGFHSTQQGRTKITGEVDQVNRKRKQRSGGPGFPSPPERQLVQNSMVMECAGCPASLSSREGHHQASQAEPGAIADRGWLPALPFGQGPALAAQYFAANAVNLKAGFAALPLKVTDASGRDRQRGIRPGSCDASCVPARRRQA
jgi:hypothetical protein